MAITDEAFKLRAQRVLASRSLFAASVSLPIHGRARSSKAAAAAITAWSSRQRPSDLQAGRKTSREASRHRDRRLARQVEGIRERQPAVSAVGWPAMSEGWSVLLRTR